MKRTVFLKLTLTQQQSDALLETQKIFSNACNRIVHFSVENRCWNRVGLHHLSYYTLREDLLFFGSQMIYNAINFLKLTAPVKVPMVAA